jgi:hypothetical protein
MKELRFTVAKAGFLLLFIGLTMVQFLSFPGQFEHMRKTQGISLLLEVALTIIVGLWLLCGQIALFCLWKIVDSMRLGRFFSRQTLGWIQRLLLSFKVATVIPMVLILILIPQADDPGFFVMLSIFTLFFFSLTATTSLMKDQIASKVAA